ncbi:hypothetical protein BGZ99_008625 [Dissophora globulifera]|uniref:F-box domain-containing protein n=1 Tax=Dissophora globulifera TaxID=979702 RepID=A0A9P6RSW1_9FUNG|nr:hypothetical protein BGZ99_008625 [Dissophora globulifera]
MISIEQRFVATLSIPAIPSVPYPSSPGARIMNINPLSIPEILIQVSNFIPLWIRKPHRSLSRNTEYLLCPGDLLACCLVSKTWRAAMLPALWRIYDESVRTFHGRIPLEVLSKYAHLFEIVHIPFSDNDNRYVGRQQWQQRFGMLRYSDIPFHASQLHELVVASDRFLYNFEISSPKARVIDIQADRGDTLNDYISTDPVHLIKRLWSLEHMRLRRYIFHSTDLEAILRCKTRLQSLELFKYCNVEERMLMVLFQALPGLESLVWAISKMNIQWFDSTVIARAIREACPRVHSLSLTVLFGRQTSDRHLVNMISSGGSGTLTRIHISTSDLWPMTIDTLLQRRDALTHLRITFRLPLTRFEKIVELVAELNRLKSFGVAGKHHDVGFTEYLKAQVIDNTETVAWMKPSLVSDVHDASTTLSDIFCRVPARWALRGYPTVNEYGRVLKIHVFDIWLLERLRSMKHINEVVVNKSFYVRDSQ